MLGSDGDLVTGRSDRLPVLPLPFVGDQPSLFEDIVEEDFHDGIMAGVDLTADPLAAADDVLCIESRSCFHAHALRLRLLLLCDHLPPTHSMFS